MIARRAVTLLRRAVDRARGSWLLPAPFVALAIVSLSRGERRWEQVVLLFVAPILAYASERTRRLLVLVYPLGLVGVLYDSMRYVRNVGLDGGVHVCDLRAFDRRFFGIGSGAARTTLPEWFQAHSSPALDLYCAIPYAIFIFVYVGYAVYLWFVDEGAMRRFAWTFFFLNVAGFATYHLYPAAPPWYYERYGCAVDLAAVASEGPNLARVDAWLGVGYFHAMYGRASEVFGAVPSLHVAYPAVILLEGWRRHHALGRALAIAFFASMAFAAIYLDHHWITDAVVGITYGVVVHFAVRTLASDAPRAVAVAERATTSAERATPSAEQP